MRQVALKVQRRRFARAALREIDVHRQLRARAGICPELAAMSEAFLYDGHICIAFERHGNSLEAALDRHPIAPERAHIITRQMLLALDYMHSCGYAHTDVKPGNILYAARASSARLADLGTARVELLQGTLCGTRNYTAPEVFIGAPLSPALDIWSLGCTVFELLSRQLLFDPHEIAAKKYREFSRGKDRMQLPLAAKVKEDAAEEKAEQLKPGAVITGKYRLQRKLGTGRFSTVWMAEQLTNLSLDTADNILREQTRGVATAEPQRSERQLRDREWQRTKGADDILDLALNYEHLLLIAAMCGPVPKGMVQSARFRASYFEEDGALRFRPVLAHVSLRNRLRRVPGLKGRALDLAIDFLQRALTIDPAQRPSARSALAHEWIGLP